MSLGGKGFFGLEDEIQEAVDSGMIVMAAAGGTTSRSSRRLPATPTASPSRPPGG
jgi:hypothetical protein